MLPYLAQRVAVLPYLSQRVAVLPYLSQRVAMLPVPGEHFDGGVPRVTHDDVTAACHRHADRKRQVVR